MEGISEALKNQQINLDFDNTRFLVIGGNGYFGYKLVEALVGKGAKHVRVLDRVQTRFLGVSDVDFMVGDIGDLDTVKNAVAGMDVIFHTASFFGDPPFGSFGDGKLVWAVNVEGTRNVIVAAREEGKKKLNNNPEAAVKVIYIGSSSAVFNGDRDFIQETEETGFPDHHVDHYGRCKAVAEKEVMAANTPSDGLLTCVLRPNGIYGENEMIHVPRIRQLASAMGGIIFVHFGQQYQCDWTFIDNLSFACMLAAEKLTYGSSLCGTDYNITDGESINVVEFFRPMMEMTEASIKPLIYIPHAVIFFFTFLAELICFLLQPIVTLRPPFTIIEGLKIAKSHSFSIEKAKKDMGYHPIVSLSEGRERTARSFKKFYYSKRKNGKQEGKEKVN